MDCGGEGMDGSARRRMTLWLDWGYGDRTWILDFDSGDDGADGVLANTDSTAKGVSSATSAASATPVPTLPFSRLRVFPTRRRLSSISERSVHLLASYIRFTILNEFPRSVLPTFTARRRRSRVPRSASSGGTSLRHNRSYM